jgi:anti-sigma factor RsiW
MQRLDDERLVAYLDGELETAQRREVEAWLDADPAARQQLAALADSTHCCGSPTTRSSTSGCPTG